MRLLVHVCCGPCSLAVLEKLLADGQEVTAFFHNPNIQPLAEYIKRREGAAQAARHFGVPVVYSDTLPDGFFDVESGSAVTQAAVTGDPHLDGLPRAVNPVAWLHAVNGREGARCETCWETRLAVTADYARVNGFAAITSTLLYSRYQNHETIRSLGEALAAKNGLGFHYEDFRSLWQRGIDMSKELGIYRQPYCGCVYSEYARYTKALQKAIAASA